MIASRTRAIVLLVAALAVGCAVGAMVSTRLRGGPMGMGPRRPGYRFGVSSYWVRSYNLDSTVAVKIDSVWRLNECVIDSLVRARIMPQYDSLYMNLVRPDVEQLRAKTRSEVRTLLPDSLRVKYDSMNAANDSTRKRMWEQRGCTGQRVDGGPRGGGPPGGDGGGRGPR